MKLVAAALASMCALCGCQAAQTAITAPPDSFDTMARVKYHELDAVVNVRYTPESCDVTFEQPNAVSGLKTSFSPLDTTLSFSSIDFTPPRALPKQSVQALLLSSLRAALSRDAPAASRDGDLCVISGPLEHGSFTLSYDAATGNILTLSIPQSSLEIELYDFKRLDYGKTEK